MYIYKLAKGVSNLLVGLVSFCSAVIYFFFGDLYKKARAQRRG